MHWWREKKRLHSQRDGFSAARAATFNTSLYPHASIVEFHVILIELMSNLKQTRGFFFLWVIASWLLSYGTKCTHTNQQHASSSDPLLVQSHLNIPPLVLTLEQLRAATISRPLSPVFIYLWAQEEHLVHFRGYVFSNKVKLPAQTKVIRCARSKWP